MVSNKVDDIIKYFIENYPDPEGIDCANIFEDYINTMMALSDDAIHYAKKCDIDSAFEAYENLITKDLELSIGYSIEPAYFKDRERFVKKLPTCILVGYNDIRGSVRDSIKKTRDLMVQELCKCQEYK